MKHEIVNGHVQIGKFKVPVADAYLKRRNFEQCILALCLEARRQIGLMQMEWLNRNGFR